jgi:peptide deformylase
VVNPKIIESSIRLAALENGEGCLSVEKDHKGLVHRNYKIKMKFYDALTNQDLTVTFSGYAAIVMQHEYDHLDGRFYYDRIDKNHPFDKKMNEEII